MVDLLAHCKYGWFQSRDKKLKEKMRNTQVTVLIDFKTGKGTNYPEWAYQTAAYRHALECQNVEVTANCAIRFNKLNGKMARPADHTPTYLIDKEIFFCLRNLWWLIWQRKQV